MRMKYARKFTFLLCGCYAYNYQGEKRLHRITATGLCTPLHRITATGLCEPLRLFQLKCQSMTKLETKHVSQAQVCDCVSTKNEMGN